MRLCQIVRLYIASQDVGDDYLEAVRQAAPYVRHLHMNDNFGKLDVGYNAEKDRLPYGEADLHLPPGWGGIPLGDALACLPDYDGYLTLEIKPRFYDHCGEALWPTHASCWPPCSLSKA